MVAGPRTGQGAAELISVGLAVMAAGLVVVSPVIASLVALGAITVTLLHLRRGTARRSWLVAALLIAVLAALASVLLLLMFVTVREDVTVAPAIAGASAHERVVVA